MTETLLCVFRSRRSIALLTKHIRTIRTTKTVAQIEHQNEPHNLLFRYMRQTRSPLLRRNSCPTCRSISMNHCDQKVMNNYSLDKQNSARALLQRGWIGRRFRRQRRRGRRRRRRSIERTIGTFLFVGCLVVTKSCSSTQNGKPWCRASHSHLFASTHLPLPVQSFWLKKQTID
jgi:hypothetical protein